MGLVPDSMSEARVDTQYDAFGRIRSSHPKTLFDSKQIINALALYWDDQQTTGGGTSSTYSQNKASSTLAVSTNTAGKRIRQTFQRFNYQPGKSHLILLTGTLCNQTTNLTGIRTQIGYFDDNNGLFFHLDEGVLKVVVRSKASGSVVDTSVAQSAWNVDKLDGTGASGLTLNFTKTNIFQIDFEWLGVGRVRFGFVIDGIFYTCHQVLNSNNKTEVYMSTPNLPLRYSIENLGTGAVTSMQQICASVVSEGGQEELGLVSYISNGLTGVAATTAGTYYALLGVRLNSSCLSQNVRIVKIAVMVTSGADFEWKLILNPTVASTFTYTQATNSGYETAIGVSANTVTGGVVLTGGYGSSGAGNLTGVFEDHDVENQFRLGSSIAGTSDTFVLCISATTNSETFYGALSIRELL